MGVKKRSVCETCRARKLGCDGKLPGCTQCAHLGRICGGYQTWTFVAHNVDATRASASKQKMNRVVMTNNDSYHKEQHSSHAHAKESALGVSDSSSNLAVLRLSIPAEPSQNQLIELLIRNYVPHDTIAGLYGSGDSTEEPRICGAWVEVLPSIRSSGSARDLILTASVEAVATSIRSRSHSLDENYVKSFQSYQLALRYLRKSFARGQHHDAELLLGSIMCLTLVELMIPCSPASFEAHLKGAALVLQTHGPEACRTGTLHRLFAGTRPLLILEAFRCRQQTFLASPAWIDGPFSLISASPMHSLLSKAAVIPSILNESDAFLNTIDNTKVASAPDWVSRFLYVLIDLENWETDFCKKSGRPCHWPYGVGLSTAGPPRSHDMPLWYPSVTPANVYTNLWAFRIICLSQLQRLASRFYSMTFEEIPLPNPLTLDHIQSYKVTLSRQISLSMECLLGDDLKLFGPASALFPLQAAYETYLEDESMWKEEITYVEDVVNQMVQKGLRSASMFVFRRKAMK